MCESEVCVSMCVCECVCVFVCVHMCVFVHTYNYVGVHVCLDTEDRILHLEGCINTPLYIYGLSQCVIMYVFVCMHVHMLHRHFCCICVN